MPDGRPAEKPQCTGDLAEAGTGEQAGPEDRLCALGAARELRRGIGKVLARLRRLRAARLLLRRLRAARLLLRRLFVRSLR